MSSTNQFTGEIDLVAITPVILALFGIFKVQSSEAGKSAYIAGDDLNYSYDSIAESVVTTMSLPPQDGFKDAVVAMAEKVGKKTEVLFFLGEDEFGGDEEASLELLFMLASIMDDGHGIKSLYVDGAWHCSKMRLGEFGGWGEFSGKAFSMGSGSYAATSTGPQVNRNLLSGDPAGAARAIHHHVSGLINGIHDKALRKQVRSFLIGELTRD